jgi:hypothetical protein
MASFVGLHTHTHTFTYIHIYTHIIRHTYTSSHTHHKITHTQHKQEVHVVNGELHQGPPPRADTPPAVNKALSEGMLHQSLCACVHVQYKLKTS